MPPTNVKSRLRDRLMKSLLVSMLLQNPKCPVPKQVLNENMKILLQNRRTLMTAR